MPVPELQPVDLSAPAGLSAALPLAGGLLAQAGVLLDPETGLPSTPATQATLAALATTAGNLLTAAQAIQAAAEALNAKAVALNTASIGGSVQLGAETLAALEIVDVGNFPSGFLAAQSGAWNVGISGTPAVSQSGAWNVGLLRTAPEAPYRLISTTGLNANLVRAGRLRLLSLLISTSTTVMVRLYDKSTTPVVGTDIPLMAPFRVPSTIFAVNYGDDGPLFSNGLGLGMTMGSMADSDTTALGSVNQCAIGLLYRMEPL